MIITYKHQSLAAALSQVTPQATSIQATKRQSVWCITATYGAPITC